MISRYIDLDIWTNRMNYESVKCVCIIKMRGISPVTMCEAEAICIDGG